MAVWSRVRRSCTTLLSSRLVAPFPPRCASKLCFSPFNAMGTFPARRNKHCNWCNAERRAFATGAVPKLATYRAPKGANGQLKGRLGAANAAGVASAKSFALLSGVYGAASCYSLRIRQKQDGAARAFASASHVQ